MSSVNKAIILGNLGRDPEVTYSAGGTAICKLSVATAQRFKDKLGEWQEKTEWHKITVFGASAENCGKYLAKGRQVYVEGRIETDSWEDDAGNKRYSTGIVAREVKFLGGRHDSQQRQQDPEPYQAPDYSGVPGYGPKDDDIPF